MAIHRKHLLAAVTLAFATSVFGPLGGLGPSAQSADAAGADSASGGWSGPTIANVARGGSALISCPSDTFCMMLDASGNVSRFDGTRWGRPATIDRSLYAEGTVPVAGALSCATATFCVAVDTIGGHGQSYSQVYDGSTWTAPAAFEPNTVTGISCVSGSSCVAVDAIGDAVTYDGTAWTAPVAVDAGGSLEAVSCVSATSCVAVGGGNRTRDAYRYDGTGWSVSTGARTLPLDHVSCVSASWCMATGGRFATRFAGSGWSRPVGIVPEKQHHQLSLVTALACSSTTLCVAANKDRALIFAGSSWSYPPSVTWLHIDTTSLSCPGPDLCVAGAMSIQTLARPFSGGRDYAIGFDGHSWSGRVLVERSDSGLASVSCPAEGTCVGVSRSGYALTDTGGTWGAPVRIDPLGGVDAVSCGTPAFCVAVSQFGEAEAYDGTTWTTPVDVDPAEGLRSVSCVGTSFCMAVSNGGHAASFDGSSWLHLTITSVTFTSGEVSCTSPTFCMALGDGTSGPEAATYDGTAWSALTPVALTGSVSLSCSSASRCLAADAKSSVAWDGSSWGQPVTFDVVGQVEALSCVTACEAVDTTGHAFRYAAGSWSAASTIDSRTLTSVSCASSSFCVAVDSLGFGFTRTAGT